jgi:hypothetical protein
MRLLALALALALALLAPAQAQLQACLTATGAAVKAQSINAGDFWFVQSRSQVTPRSSCFSQTPGTCRAL